MQLKTIIWISISLHSIFKHLECWGSTSLQTFTLLCPTWRWTMGILTVMCYEQTGLFEYFSAPGSKAGCRFVKALYCISFLCQSPFPVAVPCQTTMTLCFLQVAWRQVCHEPWGFHASQRVPPSSVCLRFSHCPFYSSLFFILHLTSMFLALLSSWLFPFSLKPVSLFATLCLALACFSSMFSSVHTPFLAASLLPSFLCAATQVRRSVRRFLCKPQVQTTPCEGISATIGSDAQ